ncbi:hypothetical protein B0H67DRAFT_684121 [Lasiosphaeris hirsuta]|uniref:LysM domain-containing protein n=1 Tax=Lasiosphaeris hirsuta TaxID=260670 RepID=A0AA40AHR1_9PEZI|nr:hypothetical protein B0H67DRAFT_684121 [Lasiosphaeris hirsuta]
MTRVSSKPCSPLRRWQQQRRQESVSLVQGLSEAEDAILQGVNVDRAQPGFTGTGYVTGFEQASDKLTFKIPSGTARLYDLTIRVGAVYGEKRTTVILNNGASCQVYFPASQTFADSSWKPGPTRHRQQTGKTPALVSVDLMDYSSSRVERGSVGTAIEVAIAHHRRGGIVSVLWHWNRWAEFTRFVSHSAQSGLASVGEYRLSEKKGLEMTGIVACEMFFQRSSLILLVAVNGVLGATPPGIGRRGGSPNLPYDPSTTTKCDYWYDNEAGSLTCNDLLETFGISLAEFRALNPTITASCGGLNKGKSYCVLGEPDGKATPSPSSTTSTTTTTAKASSTKSTSTSKPTTSKTTTASPTTTSPVGNGIATPTPTQPGIVSNCDAFYWVKQGDTCAAIAKANGITVTQFATWNTGVGGEKCAAMWANVYACVSIIGHTPTPTAPSNGITTPEPIQDGMTTSCKTFHFMQSGQTCTDLAKRYGISIDQIKAWNPAAGSQCTGLWANTYACVGVL